VNHTFERPPGFAYGSAQPPTLTCEQLALPRLAQKFATPLYVYSANMIRERVLAFETAFRESEHTLCYSVKANSNLSILRLLRSLGCGFDVVSGGELARVLRADRRAANKIVFSGVGKTREEITAALNSGILLFNLESASELDLLARSASKLKRTAEIAFRVNPDVPAETHPYISTGLQKHKFGVPIGEAPRLYAEAARSRFLRVRGVSVHIGSQITEFAPFSATMARVADVVRQLRSEGHTITSVDAGGGLGINYSQRETDFSAVVREYAQAILQPLRGLQVKVLLEPGRSIIGPAGVLLTRVLYRKQNGEKKFIIVDAAMNDLIRPALYQAEHQIVPVEQRSSQCELADIVGPVCESGDFFARDRRISSVKEGDLLAVLDAGAYGMTLASNYNSRPRAAEVLVNGTQAKLIRRRETIADLLRTELMT
jgi:diaminopimelate decarboxylase